MVLKIPNNSSNRTDMANTVFEKCIKFEEEFYEDNLVDSANITAFGYACQNRYIDIVRKMLKTSSNKHLINAGNPSPIWLACNSGHLDIVQLLLQSNDIIDVGKKAPDGTTALMMAIAKDHFAIVEAFGNALPSSVIVKECARFGKHNILSEMKPLVLQHSEKRVALKYAFKSGCLKTLKAVKELTGLDLLECDEVSTHSTEILEQMQLPMISKPSLLVDLSKHLLSIRKKSGRVDTTAPFPFFDTKVEEKKRKQNFSRSVSFEEDIEHVILGDFCYVQRHISKLKEKKCGDIPLYLREMDDLSSFECHEECLKQRDCTIILHLLQACRLLEDRLNNSDASDLMLSLKPRFIFIGSGAEGTRIAKDTEEIDITVKFTGLQNDPFTIKDKATEIFVPKMKCMEPFRKKGSDVFDYPKFFHNFLGEIHSALKDIQSQLPKTLKMKLNFIPCPECRKPKLRKSIYQPRTHCMNCLPAVAHTKLSPCLIFEWNDGTLNRPKVATIDLVAVFPIEGKSVLDLYNIVIKTLVEDSPPEWLKYFETIISRDIILPESFAAQGSLTEVAIKLLNYGPDSNYIIRPAQEMAIHDFQEVPNMKKVYCYMKALKELLQVDEAKSYVMKKVLLLPEFKAKAKEFEYSAAKFAELLYEVASHPDLKKLFCKKIDYEQWEINIAGCKKDQTKDKCKYVPIISN